MTVRNHVEFNKSFILSICLLMVPLIQFGTDLYSPSLPILATYFNVSNNQIRNTVSIYLLSMAFIPIFAGVISDQIGRRIVYLVGIFFFMIGSVLCIISSSLKIMLIGRLLQGVGAACSTVIIRSILRDLYEGNELLKSYAYYTSIWGVAICIGPFIGGVIQHFFKWQYSFYLLFLYSAFLWLVFFFKIPETSNKKNNHINIRIILKNYKNVFKNKNAISAMILGGGSATSIIAFVTLAPFIIQQKFHQSSFFYGNVALIVGLSIALTPYVNNWLINFFSPITIIKNSLYTNLILLLFAVFLPYSQTSILFILVISAISLFLCVLISVNAIGIALKPFRDTIGYASAIQSLIVWGIPTLAITIFHFFRELENPKSLIIIFITIILFNIVVLQTNLKRLTTI